MMGEKRSYLVGGSVFSVELDAPWRFMEYSRKVRARIAAAAKGCVLDIVPTRAGDEVPARTFIKAKEELHPSNTQYSLNFSQYEPFVTDREADLFSCRVLASKPQWIDSIQESDTSKLVFRQETEIPYFYVYDYNGDYIFEMKSNNNCRKAAFLMSKDKLKAEFYTEQLTGSGPVMFYLSMALMIVYSNAAASVKALLIHASVIEHNGLANLFLGESGTGKSTHARLWLESIKGSELLNDDNPVVRQETDGVYAYGTPWSGKTPCYRNKKVKIRSFVKLNQAPHNTITEIRGLNAYACLMTSVSAIRWDKSVMDNLTATCSDIAMTIPFWSLDCLPDKDAARVCCNALEHGFKQRTIDNDVLFADVIPTLRNGQQTIIPVKGFSMTPIIRHEKDLVVLEGVEAASPTGKERVRVRKYDIVLFHINGHYIIHRILDITNGMATIQGDGNIRGVEYCDLEHIYGRVVTVLRNGKRSLDPYSAAYMRQFKIWKALRPVRRYILGIYRRIH